MALFTMEERIDRLAREIDDLDDVEVQCWDDLTIQVHGQKHARKLVGDIEYVLGEVLGFDRHGVYQDRIVWRGNGLAIFIPKKSSVRHTNDGNLPWAHVIVNERT